MSQSVPPHRPIRTAASRLALPAQDEDIASLRRAIVAKLTYSVGRDPIVASERDWFVATALAVRDRIVERWVPATRAAYTQSRKRVYYLSLEFLIGRLLYDSLSNLNLVDQVRTALAEVADRTPSEVVARLEHADADGAGTKNLPKLDRLIAGL